MCMHIHVYMFALNHVWPLKPLQRGAWVRRLAPSTLARQLLQSRVPGGLYVYVRVLAYGKHPFLKAFRVHMYTFRFWLCVFFPIRHHHHHVLSFET